MADLKRCDRCKAIFEPEKPEEIPVYSEGFGEKEPIRKKRVYPTLISRAIYNGTYGQAYDLCPSCSMALNKFLHNIDEDGTES